MADVSSQLAALQASIETLRKEVASAHVETRKEVTMVSQEITTRISLLEDKLKRSAVPTKVAKKEPADNAKVSYTTGKLYVVGELSKCLDDEDYRTGDGKDFWNWFNGLKQGDVSYESFLRNKYVTELTPLQTDPSAYNKTFANKCWEEMKNNTDVKARINEFRKAYNETLVQNMTPDAKSEVVSSSSASAETSVAVPSAPVTNVDPMVEEVNVAPAPTEAKPKAPPKPKAPKKTVPKISP